MEREQYLLRIPVQLLQPVTGLEEPVRIELEDKVVRLYGWGDQSLVMEAEPFDTQDAAAAFVPRLRGALAWMCLRLGIGVVVEDHFDDVAYSDDPVKAAENLASAMDIPNTGPVHGIANGNLPSILPIGKNIRQSLTFAPAVVQTLGRKTLEEPFVNGLLNSATSVLFSDERLRTAVELFCDSHRESSIRSRFLTLVMALEVMAEPAEKHEVVQRLLTDTIANIQALRDTYDGDSDEAAALQSLERELTFRREESIGSALRGLVRKTLGFLPQNELRERVKDMVLVYDLRSRLVHTGHLSTADLRKGHKLARRLVIDLLEARIQAAR
jgi:hypothetical protein